MYEPCAPALLTRVWNCSSKTSPKESDGRGSLDAAVVNVTGCTCDDTSYDQTHDDTDVLEERGSKDFGQYDRNEGDESETDEFWRSPTIVQECERSIGLVLNIEIQFGFRRGDIGTKLEETGLWATLASVGPSSPIWDTRLADERGSDHQDDGSSYHWREYPLEDLRRHQRHENFEESTDKGCSCWIVRYSSCEKRQESYQGRIHRHRGRGVV